MRAEDCLVVDTFEFNFPILRWRAIFVVVRWVFFSALGGESDAKENRSPVLLRAGPRLNFVGTDWRDYALAGKLRFRRAMIPTASNPRVRSGSAPGSGTFAGGSS